MRDVYEELKTMERLADELRQPTQRWYVAILRTILALFEGRFEEARELIAARVGLAPTQWLPQLRRARCWNSSP